MKRSLILLPVLLPLLALATLMHSVRTQASPTVPNATFTVNSPIDATDANPGDGVCETGPGNGICTLRAAIQESNNWPGADTIMLPAMTLNLTITDGVGIDVAAWGDFDITDDLTINGIDKFTSIVDGNNLDRIFEIHADNQVHFNQLTIRNGFATDTGTNVSVGAAIYNESSTLTITNAILRDNESYGGGALVHNANFGSQALLTISNTQFISNTAIQGGGGAIGVNGNAILANSLVQNNIATYGNGGGISFSSGVMTITGSLIENNRAESFYGGGIYTPYSSRVSKLSVINSIISGNIAVKGGGIYNEKPISVQDSQILNNIATLVGGGIHSEDFSFIHNTLIAENEAITGGGVHGGNSGDFSISQSVLQGNVASHYGGGFYDVNGQSWMTATAVISNVATTVGGGIYILGDLNMINSTISGNEAGTRGGAIYQSTGFNNGILTLTNSSIINNTAPDTGGLFHDDRGEVHISNSIIAENSDYNCYGTQGFISEGHNLGDRLDCPFNQPTDLQQSDIHLGPLQNNGGNVFTHALLPFSPAVDAADNNNCPNTDQRGILRPIDTLNIDPPGCDIGAYEYDGTNDWLHIPDVMVQENLDGSPITITVPIQLWASQTETVTVSYNTASGTATSPDDFQSISGSVTFPPGNIKQTIDIIIYSNLPQEDLEFFSINLTAATNATIWDNPAIVTILDPYEIYLPMIIHEP